MPLSAKLPFFTGPEAGPAEGKLRLSCLVRYAEELLDLTRNVFSMNGSLGSFSWHMMVGSSACAWTSIMWYRMILHKELHDDDMHSSGCKSNIVENALE